MCQQHDGKVYSMAEKEEGVNFPPLHPFCRSSVAPSLDSVNRSELQRRARDPETGKNVLIPADMNYNEWKAWVADGSPDIDEWRESKKPEKTMVEGKNMVDFTPRSGKFPEMIEDIIDQQGYNGKPQLITRAQYNEMIAQGRPAMNRTYTADSQATLDAYKEQLRRGDFYVDCSVGGSQYGKGMYTATAWDPSDTEQRNGLQKEMLHYRKLGLDRGFKFGKVEYMTLDPSAKVIKYSRVTSTYFDEMSKAGQIKFPEPTMQEAMSKALNLYAEADDAYTRGEMITGRLLAQDADKIKETWVESQRHGKTIPYKTIERDWDDIESGYLTNKDVGVQAASMGYDAINAEGHGESGSYTVILNRTKVLLVDGN